MAKPIAMLVVLLLCYLIILSFDTAYESLKHDADSQLFASVSAARTNYHHHAKGMYIIFRLLILLSPAILLTAVLYVLLSGSAKESYPDFRFNRRRWFGIMAGVSASVPMPFHQNKHGISCYQAFRILPSG